MSTHLVAKIRKIPSLISNLGILGTIRFILAWARKRYANGLLAPNIDIFKFYEFLAPPSEPITIGLENIEPNTINWIIPGFEIGSGGHLNIFRMIWGLEKHGYKNHIFIVGDCYFSSGEAAREAITTHFCPLSASVWIGEGSLKAAEFTVATSWITAYTVRRFTATRHKIYFIQDMEPWFSPHGSDYVFAEATYRFGFTAITAGDWLAKLMREDYGMKAYPFGFSYEHDRYAPGTRKPGPRRVFFYARHVTARRGFELGMLTLKRVYERLPDIEFVLAGWDTSNYVIPFPHLNAGVVSLDELPDLYVQCDAALVISLTNISLLPLELMACGCPVISNNGPNVEWLLKNGETALLTEPSPEALASALVEVMQNSELHSRLRENGLEFARQTNWADETGKVHGYLEMIRRSQ